MPDAAVLGDPEPKVDKRTAEYRAWKERQPKDAAAAPDEPAVTYKCIPPEEFFMRFFPEMVVSQLRMMQQFEVADSINALIGIASKSYECYAKATQGACEQLRAKGY